MPPSPLLPLYLQKLRDTAMHLWGIVIVMGSEGYLLPKFCHISTGNVKKTAWKLEVHFGKSVKSDMPDF